MNFFSSFRRDHSRSDRNTNEASLPPVLHSSGNQQQQTMFNPVEDVVADDVVTLSTGPTTATATGTGTVSADSATATLYGMKIMDDDETQKGNDIEEQQQQQQLQLQQRYHISRDDAESIVLGEQSDNDSMGHSNSNSNNGLYQCQNTRPSSSSSTAISATGRTSRRRKLGMTFCGFCDVRIASIVMIVLHVLYGLMSTAWIVMGYDFPSSNNTSVESIFPISTICVTLVSLCGVVKYSHIVTRIGLVGTVVISIIYLSRSNYVGTCLGLLLISTQTVFVREVRKGIMTKETYEGQSGQKERYLHRHGQRVWDGAVILKQEMVKSSSLIGQQFIDSSNQILASRVTSELSTSMCEQLPRTVSRMITEQSEPYLPTTTTLSGTADFVQMKDGNDGHNQPQKKQERNHITPNSTTRPNTTPELPAADCDALATSPKDVTDVRLIENRIGIIKKKTTTVNMNHGEDKDGEISSDSENYDDYRRLT